VAGTFGGDDRSGKMMRGFGLGTFHLISDDKGGCPGDWVDG